MGIREDVMDAWDNTLSPMFDEFASDVAVQVIDTEATVKDELYGEAEEEKVYLPAVLLKARVKLERDRLVLPSGESVDVDGRATFKTEELQQKSVTLDFGVRVIYRTVPYTVVHIEGSSSVGNDILLMRVYLKGELDGKDRTVG